MLPDADDKWYLLAAGGSLGKEIHIWQVSNSSITCNTEFEEDAEWASHFDIRAAILPSHGEVSAREKYFRADRMAYKMCIREQAIYRWSL